MTPKQVEQLQKEAMDLFNGATVSFPSGEGFERGVLLAACAKAMTLALKLEALQKSSVFHPVNQLWRLADALQSIAIVDTFEHQVDRKKAEKKCAKALADWNAFLKELPKQLEKDRELLVGLSESKLAKVATELANEMAAEKAVPAKKPAAKKVAAKKLAK